MIIFRGMYTVLYDEKLIRIENHCDMILIVSEMPIRPKRKYNDIAYIQPRTFLVWDFKDIAIDPYRLSFRFQKDELQPFDNYIEEGHHHKRANTVLRDL